VSIVEQPGASRLRLGTILTFSATSLPISALGVALSIFLQPYIAGHLGVGLTVVGFAYFVARMIDLPVDPLLGVFMDRTRTKLGRYRVWMVAGAPILMLGVYMLFMAPKGIGLIYLIVWLLVMYLGSSMATLSHTAWGAVLATNYNERSRVFGLLAAVGVVGALLVLGVAALAGKDADKHAALVPQMGWFVIATIPICIGLVAVFTPEKIAPDVKDGRPRFALSDYLALASRPEMIRLLAAEVALTMGPGWMAALYLFFFRDFLGFSTGGASGLLGVYVAAGVFGAPLTGWLATRFGKHRTLMATTTAYSLGLTTVLVIPHGNVLAALPTMFWCGFMASGFGLMIRAMIADVGDEIRLEQGKERISLVYALLTMVSKAANAVAVVICYPLLDFFGYHAKDSGGHSPAAIRALEIIYLFGPIFFVMLGGACFIGWKLDSVKHGEIRRELDARDALYDQAPIIESVEGPGF
jgi:GPH family glycoside/pentoside/hexuronide:cation symporter